MENVVSQPPNPRTVRLLAAWLPFALYAALIFYLSGRPGSRLPDWWILHFDKVLHTVEYYGFGVLLARALRTSGSPLAPACAWAVALACIFGATDEFHQSFVPGRQGNDLGDLLADNTGAIAGVISVALWAKQHRPREARA